jgi:hypothetical protein
MLGVLDHVDVGGLVAPRRLLVESGTGDLIFPADAAARELARLRRVYAALGAADAVEHDIFEGEHRWNGLRVPGFLARVLGDPA